MSVRVGLLGLGQIYPAHLAGYREARGDVTIVAVCDADAERAAAVGLELGAKSYSDYRELFGSGGIDAVDIMLPHHLHEEAVAAAIEAGLHVLVEKPAAPTERAVAALEQAARQHGVMLAVAENTRFSKAYLVVADLLQSGKIGTVELVRTLICGNETHRLQTVSNWKGRKSGTLGGAIFDAGAHSFYLLNWLFGGVETLLASASIRTPESEVEDFGIVLGTLYSGADFVTEYTFTAEIPWNERLEVYGSKGSVIVDQLADPVLKVFYGKTEGSGQLQGPWQDNWDGQGVDSVPYRPSTWKQESIADEVVDFVRAVAEGRPHGVSLMDVRAAMLAIEAAYDSISAGSTRMSVGRPS